jgi:putative ATP-dependent endonuclease of the OLD family
MFISKVHIKNYRNFADCEIPLSKGLSVLIGENNVGKSNLLSAMGLLFSADASARTRQLTLEDFCVDVCRTEELPEISISCTLTDFRTDAERSVVATWLTRNPHEARVAFLFRCSAKGKTAYKINEPIPIDEYQWTIFGGESETKGVFEFDQLQKIVLELLGALRDAEHDLSPGARGNVARVLRHFQTNESERSNITEAIKDLNKMLEQTGQVKGAQKSINERLIEIGGQTNAQETRLTPVGAKYDDLIRNVKVEVRSVGNEFRSVEWNGLGSNNLLFISVLLADYVTKREGHKLILPMMAIEEPEAHLHPHLQKLLNRNFGKYATEAQVIATTHSTHITSSVHLDSLIAMNRDGQRNLQAVNIGSLFPLSAEGKREKLDLERYLDATKSTLFFARSVLLVEGIAEALIIPILARKCMTPSFDLDEKRISVVAVHGISFRPFMRLFGTNALRRKCAVLTDADDKTYQLDDDKVVHSAAAAALIRDYGGNKDPYVSVFTNLKTFEFDLAIATKDTSRKTDPTSYLNNEGHIRRALQNTDGVSKGKIPETGKITNRVEFGKTIVELVEESKGRFAQALASEIDEKFVIPPYIKQALDFLLNSTL